MKKALLLLARSLGVFSLSRRLTAQRLRILCYHGVWLGGSEPNPFNFLYMQPERFAQRLLLIRRLGLPVLPLGEALQRLRQGSLPRCAVTITIDDGWYGTYKHMLPALAAQQLPATLYLTTHHVETATPVFGVAMQFVLLTAPRRSLLASSLPGLSTDLRRFDLDQVAQRNEAQELLDGCARALPEASQREALLWQVAKHLGLDGQRMREERWFHLMSSDEARACEAQGIDLQLHTHRHRVSHLGTSCIAEEIADNRARLKVLSARPTEHFCYPSGRWQPEDFRALRNAGVISATTTDNGLCTAQTEPLALPRVLDGDRLSDIELEAELCGLMDLKRQWLRRWT